MKKLFFYLIACAFLTTHMPAEASYLAINDSTSDKHVGGTASQAEDDARVISMLGWGIGLAAAIAIIAAVVHQSKGSADNDNPPDDGS